MIPVWPSRFPWDTESRSVLSGLLGLADLWPRVGLEWDQSQWDTCKAKEPLALRGAFGVMLVPMGVPSVPRATTWPGRRWRGPESLWDPQAGPWWAHDLGPGIPALDFQHTWQILSWEVVFWVELMDVGSVYLPA